MPDGSGTFVFADLGGFAALTEAHGDEEAVKLVEEFAEAVKAELPAVRGADAKRCATSPNRSTSSRRSELGRAIDSPSIRSAGWSSIPTAPPDGSCTRRAPT